ncbi:MAG: hypothetical protein LBQ33_02270 [Oscillospiraceae bacterium]|jgi:hypothetical protein|nr:hypothetical protein [Oscillospiraceae bacterium]
MATQPEANGITAEALKSMAQQLKEVRQAQAEAQKLEQLAQQGITQEQQQKLREVMRDKAKLKELLSSAKAKELLEKLQGK